jgi:hypothetical protein
MVHLPLTYHSEDTGYGSAPIPAPASREKPKNHNIFVRGGLGDVCVSFRRGMVFLLHLALIDYAPNPMPREKPNNQKISAMECTTNVPPSGEAWFSFCPCFVADACAGGDGGREQLAPVQDLDQARLQSQGVATTWYIYIYLRHSLHVTLCTSLSSYARARAHAHAISAPHPLHVALCTWLPARHSLHVAPRASLSARHSLYVTHRTSLSARHSLHVVLCGFGGVLTHVTRVPFFGDVQSEWVSNGASHVNTVPLS